MITGAGASVSFGFPSTPRFTKLIDNALRVDPSISSSSISLFDAIIERLNNYLVNPGLVTFEDIYQCIQDVRVIQTIPANPGAFDEFRPRVGATHVLASTLGSYSSSDGWLLQEVYLNIILDSFLNALPSVSGISQLSAALKYIESKCIVWSFTLNYDNLISDIWSSFTSGFNPGRAPRVFDPNLLLSGLSSLDAIHSHLHGSLKWGFLKSLSTDLFELHEFDNPKDGVQNSKSRPSGRPAQKGESLPFSPIITGLDKTELVFRQPFFTNFMAFFRSLSLCSDILIAGYGFSDRHVNMGIQQCRRYRPYVRTYIIDKDNLDHPSSYIGRLTPDAWNTILPGEGAYSTEVPGFPGWWRVPGISGSRFNTGPIFLWLKGFDEFCKTIVKDGFPG